MQDAIDFLAKDTVLKLLLKKKYNIPFRPQGLRLGFIDLRTTSLDRFKATFKITEGYVFEPRIVFDLSDAEFRTIGVSRQKTSYIKALATALINKELDLDSLPSKRQRRNSLKSKE
jgi:DNA-3-methyladenine glycosylase II